LSRGSWLTLLAAPVGLVLTCGLAVQVVGGDPMLVAELVLAVVIAAWLLLIVRSARPAAVARHHLDQIAVTERVQQHEVRLVHSAGASAAFVAGAVQPAIYVGRRLLDILDSDELRGVLLHEEHHRRRRDPLRAIAISSWGTMFAGVPAIREWTARRIARLELEADRFAVAHGASPAAIASALLKCDRSWDTLAVGFASSVDLRVRGLLDTRGPVHPGARAPMEWLAPTTLAITLLVCHLFVG
jgi:Zn-dependent protease with chaperone function